MRRGSRGRSIVLSSADLSELLALSDRLLVFYRGRIVAAFLNREDLSPETLGTYMLGLSEQTVQVQVQRAMKRCEAFLARRGL